MALLPVSSPTEGRLDTQETMFEEPTDFPSLGSQESAYEEPAEFSYEPAEEFSAEAIESGSGEGTEGLVEGDSAEALRGEPRLEPDPDSTPEPTLTPFEPETHSARSENQVSAGETEPMTVLTVDDFAALEERVLRAVSLVRREREERIAADERAAAAEARLQAQLEFQNPAIDRLEREVESLRAEREQVRQRVERLLGQLDALEL